MKCWEIFRFELRYQLLRPVTWIYFSIFLLLTFAMVLSFTDNVYSGDYLLNAPVVTAAITTIASLLALLVIAAVAGDAAIHDRREHIDPLLYTLPISKMDYLGGRLLGAFAVITLVLLALPLGLMLAVFIPGIDASLFGPFRLTPYLSSFFLLALPTAFVTTAVLFAIAVLGRHALLSFLGGGLLFMIALVSKELLADHMGQWQLARQLDFSGFTIVSEFRKTQTPLEINTQAVPVGGWLLWNRVLWLLIASGFLALAFMRFQLAHHIGNSWWSRLFKQKIMDAPIGSIGPIAVPETCPVFDRFTWLYQTATITFQTYRENLASWGWIALAGIGGMLLVLLPEWLEGAMGVPTFPTTARILVVYQQFLFQMTVVAVIVFYVGQLIWRERDARMGDVADAMPVTDGVYLLSKLLSVGLLLVTLQLVFLLAGIVTQLSQGFNQVEIYLYLRILFGLQLADYLLFAVLALFVHVLVNHKYLGHLILFVTFLYTVFAAELGVSNNLLVYGADLGWSYRDMSGFGSSLTPWFWFKLYWAGWALLLAILTRLLWVRGRETDLKQRLKRALVRPHNTIWVVAAGAMLLLLSSGTFVYYNTHVLNSQASGQELAAQRAAYERLYGKYSGAPQPKHTATRLHVELYPERQEAFVYGVYTLHNKSQVEIDTIHIATASGVDTRHVLFDRAGATVLDDREQHHTIYVLDQALQPGDSLELEFELYYQSDSFTSDSKSQLVAANGTYFLNHDLLPAIGYQSNRELRSAHDRRAQQLPPKPAIQPLQHGEGQQQQQSADLERIRFEAVVGTAPDQIAVTSGTMPYSWMHKGRRYFHYVADAPIRNLYAFYSAAYAVRETWWQDILIQVLYHPGHTHHVDRMMQSVQASLKYYTRHFGPYPHRELRLVEYPGAGSGASAYPGTIALTESFSLLNPDEDWREMDLAFAVGAHEVAHQWWAHQVVPAAMEGAALLTESLAWYSALGVVEATHGPQHLESLLWAMRQSYLSPRTRADVPLLRATDPFLAYRKGPFAMYALKEYLGEAQVNRALRNLLKKFGAGEPPLPTSLNLYSELQAVTPDSLHYLLADLFEKNTYWDVATTEAVAMPVTDGQWQVTLQVQAQKAAVDTVGKETPLPLHDLIEVGVYAAGKEGEMGELLYLHKHWVRAPEQQITLTMPFKPAHAGIDPRHLLIDPDMVDNVRKVSIRKTAPPHQTLYVRQSKQLVHFMLDTMF